ncbi:membrane-bound lytic murein transglycosylase MltF [Nitrincola alkalilacustris]|uniref:membrane-bound lytic murein transglycosylase MltF n=1 Tax=Nitrincola alkalilacustris TaxID=1571224 RepID=UPI00124BE079|nr:membrane-bound lytic murein transglycosylase MltF [Nitrincola alkalilacustris]
MFSSRQYPHIRALIYLISLILITFVLVLIGLNTSSQVETIRKQGVLRVGTLNNPMSYYLYRSEPAGFEYELSKAFADFLGVELELIVARDLKELFDLQRNRSVHLIAANLMVTEQRRRQLEHGPVYRYSAPTVIYRVRQGIPAPESIEDLYDSDLAVLSGSSYADLLQSLSEEHPDLVWSEKTDIDIIDLMRKIHEMELDYTIMDTFLFDAQSSFFPGLRRTLLLDDPQPVSWLLARNPDNTLKTQLQHFFDTRQTKDLIADLEIRYFSQQNRLNFFDTASFRQHLQERFPSLQQHFLEAAEQTGFEWSLLAALAYQESHWDPDAVSPTGVRGIMMLTNAAASEVDVTDRTDPVQSIFGGARYLQNVKKRIPERIPEPDHTWFALAAYNVGYGHLEDARRLAQSKGLDPDIWEDVRSVLPLLAQERYYSQLRYGYARGHEPVTYVDNIQKYIEILEWEIQTSLARALEEALAEEEQESGDTPPDTGERILRSISPSL